MPESAVITERIGEERFKLPTRLRGDGVFDLWKKLVRDPAGFCTEVMLRHKNDIVLVDLKLANLYVVTHPNHVEHILVRNHKNYWNGATKMLRHCHKAMNGSGKLLVIEMVMPPGNEPFFGKWLDLLMLLIAGMDRTEAEYRTLFNAAGFNLTKIIPTQSPVSVIEGVPV